MAEVEAANRTRGAGTFPEEWGTPPGSPYSEARARWILQKVREHQALTAMRRRAREIAQAGIERVRRERQLLLARRTPYHG